MPAGSKSKLHRRNNKPSFVGLPRHIVEHPNFIGLSASGVKLLIDIYQQYRGKNNGDLCASFTIMKERGWVSKSTLSESIKELLYYGFITKTRQGGLHMGATLYAVTWQPIDECKGKLDVKSTTVPSNDWKVEKPPYSRKIKKMTVQKPYLIGTDSVPQDVKRG